MGLIVQTIKEKVEEVKIQAANATADSRENMKVTWQNVKGDAVCYGEAFRRKAERSKSKISSELLRAQMNLQVKKEEIAKELDKHKYKNEKVKEETKAKTVAADAAILMDYALDIAEQAAIAGMEAEKLAREYQEKYGEELVLDAYDDEPEEKIIKGING